ncbi:hypothetical protein D7W82_26765 [Corallococcus sp. CA049B]|uniref:hypothetical protein n=1 Tax=Corallococcus sp. CA049B TaxID=2316730 RepID=UPI000EA1B5BE|nr:hypothetical protein [Corallococcus sp. CA049B]NOJ95228.1 hypothetical protein [Corallococcus coralloides]RKG82368.1 hypothetical protein D7W82_26765 [Corallococcus sp. CA049B]
MPPPSLASRGGFASSKFALWLMCLALFGIYITSPARLQTDSLWSIPSAASILHEGNTDLDEYRSSFFPGTAYARNEAGGRTYYVYPPGVMVSALPFLAAAEGLISLMQPVLPHLGTFGAEALAWRELFRRTGGVDLSSFARTENLIASFYVCATAAVLLVTLRKRVSPGAALVTVLLFGLGTTVYSTASRVLWQHGPGLLTIACVMLLLARPEQTARTALPLGFWVAAAYACRPTHSLSVLVVTGFMALRFRRQLPAYFAGAALVAIPFCAYHLSVYGSVFSPYYRHSVDPFAGPFFMALAANLVSPSRGLFTFSPFLVLGVVGFLQRWRSRSLEPYEVVFALIFILHWAVISSFFIWWAGHSIGPRFFTDVLPYLVYFLAFPVQAVLEAPSRHRVLAGALVVTALFSVFVHWRASNSYDVHNWNSWPVNVDRNPAHVWDWRDAQFLRAFPSRSR